MKTDWAAEQLQTIRTLMERSALYRRALAPVTLLAGAAGLAAGALGWWLQITQTRAFIGFWAGVALVALVGGLLLIRRQALKAGEPIWSLPTRRVGQAMALPLFSGTLISLMVFLTESESSTEANISLVPVWLLLYGLALNAAGFFAQRGIRLFGWLMALCGFGLGFFLVFGHDDALDFGPRVHLLMGGLFGGPHLAYGLYLNFTEKRL